MSSFRPPFCPNTACDWHCLSRAETYLQYCRNGTYLLRGERRQRFRCVCGRMFSDRTFHINFRYKKIDEGLSAKILKVFIIGASNRQIARHVQVSEKCVRGRLARLAVWGMLIHREKLNRLKDIDEAICYDGLENFAGSQYDPSWINQAVGSESLFVYDFNFSPLNRKGRMSERQKERNKNLETTVGKYPKFAIQTATEVLFQRLHALNADNKPLIIFSDEHYQYKRALARLPKAHFEHKTISAKATRNFQNILFPVNHLDLMVRHEVGAFTRETISFAKTAARMCQKFALFMVYRNYMAPQFTKKQKRRPDAETVSPAQRLGIETKILDFGGFFSRLRTAEQVKPPSDWLMITRNQVPYPRSKEIH